MDEKLIQKYFDSINKDRFDLVAKQFDSQGNPNSIYWKVNSKSFLDNFENWTIKELAIKNYEEKNYVHLIKKLTNRILELHITIFSYITSGRPEFMKTKVDIKYHDLLDHLFHLKNLSLDITEIARDDKKSAFKMRGLFIQGIYEVKQFIESQFIRINDGPLSQQIDEIINKYDNTLSLKDISMEVELSRLPINSKNENGNYSEIKPIQWVGDDNVQLVELIKALIESGKLESGLSQKEIFTRFSRFFNIEINERKGIENIQSRKPEIPGNTLPYLNKFLDDLKKGLYDWYDKKEKEKNYR